MSRYYVYATGPIDFWQGWNKPDDKYADIGRVHFILERFSEVAVLAHDKGWEGDIREGPYWIPVPFDDSGRCDVILAWKQDNNNTTFVASPVRLPWLSSRDEEGPIV